MSTLFLSFLYKIKNIEAEICEILVYSKNKSEAKIVKRTKCRIRALKICKYKTLICVYLTV